MPRSFNGVDNGNVPLENAIYVKMNPVNDNLGEKITGKDVGKKGEHPVDNMSAEQLSPLELEIEDMSKLSGRGGLNEGYEDEDEIQPILFPAVIPIDQFNNEAFTAMESQLTDLFYLGNDICKTRGMNQKFAMEAMRIKPDFGNVPLGFYSTDPTATRLKPSLEEITETVVDLMKRMETHMSQTPEKVDLDEQEQYRMQMAAISTAALGYCNSLKKVHEDYITPALKDVIKLYKKYDALFQIDPDKSMKVLEKKKLR